MLAHARLLSKSLEPLQCGKDLCMRQGDMEIGEELKSGAPIWRRKHSIVAGRKTRPHITTV